MKVKMYREEKERKNEWKSERVKVLNTNVMLIRLMESSEIETFYILTQHCIISTNVIQNDSVS